MTFDIAEGADRTGDLHAIDVVRAAMEGCERVVHAGAIPSNRAGMEEKVFSSNAVGTWNVLQAAQEQGIGRVVVFSSVNAFGSFGVERPMAYLPGDDDWPNLFWGPYQLAKHVVEEVAAYFAQNHAMTVPCLRPMLVASEPHYQRWFGPEGKGPSAHLVSEFWGYVDLRDVVEAVFCGLFHENFTGFGAFLLAADDTASTTPTAEIVARDYPDVPWKGDRDVWLAGGTHRGLIDCREAKEKLGWRPRHSWRDTARG